MTRILVIDDHELVGKLLEESLKAEGFEVAVALDANSGYATAIEFLPDLILLDVQLPDIAGFDLCRVIKNRLELRDVPIIMVTGTARSTEDKVKGFQMGVDDYVLKPFEMPELVERIKAVLRRCQARRSTGKNSIASKAVQSASSDSREGFQTATSITYASKTIPATAVAPSPRSVAMNLLLAPQRFPSNALLPRVSILFLLVLLGLVFSGLAANAGTTAKPALVGLGILAVWGALAAVLVIACSLLGIPLGWREGARLLSLAGTPILLKMGGALAMSLYTTLSPFYFSASPILFWSAGSPVLARLDFFELWSAGLLWVLLKGRPNSSPKKAAIVVAVVWLAALGISLGVVRFGGGS
jgi:DNA-binding response OmpR family regulator